MGLALKGFKETQKSGNDEPYVDENKSRPWRGGGREGETTPVRDHSLPCKTFGAITNSRRVCDMFVAVAVCSCCAVGCGVFPGRVIFGVVALGVLIFVRLLLCGNVQRELQCRCLLIYFGVSQL